MNSLNVTPIYPFACPSACPSGPTLHITAGLLALALLLAGCTSTESVQETEAVATDTPAEPPPVASRVDNLSNTEWKAANIIGKPAGSAASTLAFAADGRVYGNGGCNGYQGDVTLENNTIVFGALATTRMMCPPPVNGQETVFLEALGLARSWTISGDMLELHDEAGVVLVKLSRQ